MLRKRSFLKYIDRSVLDFEDICTSTDQACSTGSVHVDACECPSPMAFQEIINGAYFEETEAGKYLQKPKSSQNVSEHSYGGVTVEESAKKKQIRKQRKKKIQTYSLPVVNLHNYIGSYNYVIGTSDSFDTAIAIAEDFKAWSSSDNTQVTESNKIDTSTELLLRCALDRGNIELACQDILSSKRLRSIIMHQLMASAGSRMFSLKKRKNGPIAYIMRKDVNEMKDFSWNSIFNEAYAIMPEVVQLLMVTMMGKIRNGVRDVNELKKVIIKIGMIYCVVANNYDGELSLLQRVIATVLHDSNCQRKVKIIVVSIFAL